MTQHEFLKSGKLLQAKAKLRPYQLVAAEAMLADPRKGLEFDDMGLGKTLTTLFVSLSVIQDEFKHNGGSTIIPFRILVLCSTNALYVWKDEIEKWFELHCIVYAGTPSKKKKLWEEFFFFDWNMFLVTTYGMAKNLADTHWDVIICDEIHNPAAGLLNHKNITYGIIEKLMRNCSRKYLLTGTPIRQGAKDLYGPLHLMDPKRFVSYWQFVNKYCITTDTPFGKRIERRPRNVAEFRDLMSKYMVRRMKTEVLDELPPKQRIVVPICMTPLQGQAYQKIMEELLYADEDTTVVAPNKMSAVLRCRQLLVTPRLLGIDEDGAAFNYLSEVADTMITAERPFVVFTPFRQAVELIKDLIVTTDKTVKVYCVHGGMTAQAFADQWQGFQNSTATKKALICVIKSGASFQATTADCCFFLGYEWDFNLNVQSEDRCWRIGQRNAVDCFYPLYVGETTDEMVREKLNSKQDASNWIIGTESQYNAMLKALSDKRLNKNKD